MRTSISLEQGKRLQAAMLSLVSTLEAVMRSPIRKRCRADRNLRVLSGRVARDWSAVQPSKTFVYDTRENRWIALLLSSLTTHLEDLGQRYAVDPEAEDLLLDVQNEWSKAVAHFFVFIPRLKTSLTE